MNIKMFKRICKITFIAHGATVYSLDGIVNDTLKYPKINEFGEEEIDKVCEYLEKRGVAYDKIYSSPNACCIESANTIAKLFKQKAISIDLTQRNHGTWHGMFYADIFKEFGSEALTKTPENGEPLKDFNKRVQKIIKKIVKENKGNRVIIVTTPEIIQSAVAKTLGIPVEYQHRTLIKTGSLTQISYFEGWESLIYSNYIPL